MTTANNDLVPAKIDQQKDLVHLKELVTEITDLKIGFKDLTIENPDDKDGYEKVRAAIGILRPKRTGLEAERKGIVKPYNDTVKLINSEYEKITTLIQEGPGGEIELKAKKEAIDNIIEQQKEEQKRLEEQKINDRINELIKNGMVFDGEYYSIKAPELGIPETSLGVVSIRTMSDELFKDHLQMIIEKAGKITAEKERVAAAAKKEQDEKEAAEKKEREEFAAKKKALDEQEAAIKKQQEEIAAQQKKIDDANKAAEQNRINGIMRHRSAVLTGMELEYNSQGSFDYNGEVLIADAATIVEHDDVEWIDLLEKLKAIISSKKFAAAEFLRKKQEEESQRLKQQEIDRLAGLSDKQRMQEYIDALLAIPVPPLTTKTWKTRAGTVRDYITDNRPA